MKEHMHMKDFNIMMDRVIYINDQTDEGMKALISRRNPNFDGMDEEKQNNEEIGRTTG